MAQTANPACRQTAAGLLEAAESDYTALYQDLNSVLRGYSEEAWKERGETADIVADLIKTGYRIKDTKPPQNPASCILNPATQ